MSNKEDFASLQNSLKLLEKTIPKKYFTILVSFIDGYLEAVEAREKEIETLLLFLDLAKEQFQTPYSFAPYHQKIREPVDYYAFANDFVRPLIDLPRSKLFGKENLKKMERALEKKENIILLANHQTETDPQVLSILLEKEFPQLGGAIIYVAGERVITDPLAIPFSMGCDLLCIYSKRYIDHPPELKAEKQRHNKSTMDLMSQLLKEGGKIIFVAPSGGRDRKNEQGAIEVAPFDPDSIEMFSLMVKRAKRTAHFYPLVLATYDLLPPPETIQKELGEKRIAQKAAVIASFLDEVSLENFPGAEEKDKHQRRLYQRDAVFTKVVSEYERIEKLL